MKKTDFGIVLFHWLFFVGIIGAAGTGLLYIFKDYQPYFTWLFLTDKMGPTHLWLGMLVAIGLGLYLWYLRQKNFFNRFQLHFNIIVGGQIRWKYISIICYWILFIAICIETITGIFLTKLIDWKMMTEYLYVPKSHFLFLHYYLVWLILAFPIIHVILHWLDGGFRKLVSIFRPQIFPRRPSLVEIMVGMKEENTRLKEKLRESSSRSNASVVKPGAGTGK